VEDWKWDKDKETKKVETEVYREAVEKNERERWIKAWKEWNSLRKKT